MLLLIKGKTTGDHDVREYDEMRAHDMAVDMVRNWAEHREHPITEADIRELNRIILVRPFWKEAITTEGQRTKKKIIPGAYKKTPNHVLLPNGEIFRYAEPDEVEPKMLELIEWYRGEAEKLHPVIVAATLHYRLVRIHPFDDGNGRVARLLMNHHLLKEDMPPVIIKSEDKRNYLTALSRADAGDLDAFVQYIAEQALWSLDLAIRAAKGEPVEEDEDWKKKASLLKKQKPVNEVVQRESKVMLARYQDSIFPLLQELKETLSEQFDPMFLDHEVKITLKNRFSLWPGKSKVEDAIQKGEVDRLFWTYHWKGYSLEEKNIFDAHLDLVIYFDDYQYWMEEVNNNFSTSKKVYTEVFEKSERNTFVNQAGQFVFRLIEKKSGS